MIFFLELLEMYCFIVGTSEENLMGALKKSCFRTVEGASYFAGINDLFA